MATKLAHVAIAVKDLDKASQLYKDLGIAFLDEREEVPSQKVVTAFGLLTDKKNGPMVELLKSTSEEGPIGKYIEKKGEGIHHLCLEVDDIHQKTQELKEKGYQFLYPEAQVGAHQCLVNFIHPKSAMGVLIEISQKVDKDEKTE